MTTMTAIQYDNPSGLWRTVCYYKGNDGFESFALTQNSENTAHDVAQAMIGHKTAHGQILVVSVQYQSKTDGDWIETSEYCH
jgi:hypothetical protein